MDVAVAGEETKQATPAVDLSPPSRPAPTAQPEPAITPPPAPIPLSESPLKPEIVESDVGRIDLTTAPVTPTATEGPAFYSHWWFWTAAGVLVAGAAVGIYASSATKSPAAPGSTLGSKRVF